MCWSGVTAGIMFGGMGVWKMISAKRHIDEVVQLIDDAKKQMILDTKGYHLDRPGDQLLKVAFEGLTDRYFYYIQP